MNKLNNTIYNIQLKLRFLADSLEEFIEDDQDPVSDAWRVLVLREALEMACRQLSAYQGVAYLTDLSDIKSISYESLMLHYVNQAEIQIEQEK